MPKLLTVTMNRVIAAASKRAAVSLRNKHAAATYYPPARLFAARHFSDSASGDDAEIKVGSVIYYHPQKQFGFILPDGVDEANSQPEDRFFIHRDDIRKLTSEDGEIFFPTLRKGQRVQFKPGPPDEGSPSARAFDLTMEGGDFVPPFEPNHMEKYTKRLKARFGEKVFEIFSTSKDQKELEERIVEDYNMTKAKLEKRAEKVQKAKEVLGVDVKDQVEEEDGESQEVVEEEKEEEKKEA